MSSNKELIQKADMVLSDLTAHGLLNPEQNKKFIRSLITYPTILKQVRAVTMNGPTMKINKIWFGSRILRPASQTGTEPGGNTPAGLANTVNARRLAVADRAKPDLAQIELNTKEIIAEIRLPYEVLEDNIEGGSVSASEQAGGLQSTIIQLIAERAAVDLEELALNGDTANGGDAYLALHDGYLKRVTSNLVAVGGALTKDAAKAAIKAMPDQYLRNRAALTHFFSVDNETELRDQYANRPTGLGDANLQGNLPLYVFGSKVEAAPMMPSANGLFCDPKNLIFGIQRAVSMEYDKDIRSREFIIVLTCRVAFQIEEETAVVKYTTIS